MVGLPNMVLFDFGCRNFWGRSNPFCLPNTTIPYPRISLYYYNSFASQTLHKIIVKNKRDCPDKLNRVYWCVVWDNLFDEVICNHFQRYSRRLTKKRLGLLDYYVNLQVIRPILINYFYKIKYHLIIL